MIIGWITTTSLTGMVVNEGKHSKTSLIIQPECIDHNFADDYPQYYHTVGLLIKE